jgi:hypothetical protein
VHTPKNNRFESVFLAKIDHSSCWKSKHSLYLLGVGWLELAGFLRCYGAIGVRLPYHTHLLDAACTRTLDVFSWTSLEGRTIIREILEEHIPQWRNGPCPAQLDCWSQTLAWRPTILIASTDWGKTSIFSVPILILQRLHSHPKPRVPRLPS